MALKRGIDQATASAVEDLKKLAKPVKGGRAKVVVDKDNTTIVEGGGLPFHGLEARF